MKWFKRNGILFIPVSLPGWIIFFAAIIYAVYVFIDLNNHSHSVSDLVRNFVFHLIIIGIVYTLAAVVTSRKND